MFGYIAAFAILVAAFTIWKDAYEGGYLLYAAMNVGGVILLAYGGINHSVIHIGIGGALLIAPYVFAKR